MAKSALTVFLLAILTVWFGASRGLLTEAVDTVETSSFRGAGLSQSMVSAKLALKQSTTPSPTAAPESEPQAESHGHIGTRAGADEPVPELYVAPEVGAGEPVPELYVAPEVGAEEPVPELYVAPEAGPEEPVPELYVAPEAGSEEPVPELAREVGGEELLKEEEVFKNVDVDVTVNEIYHIDMAALPVEPGLPITPGTPIEDSEPEALPEEDNVSDDVEVDSEDNDSVELVDNRDPLEPLEGDNEPLEGDNELVDGDNELVDGDNELVEGDNEFVQDDPYAEEMPETGDMTHMDESDADLLIDGQGVFEDVVEEFAPENFDIAAANSTLLGLIKYGLELVLTDKLMAETTASVEKAE